MSKRTLETPRCKDVTGSAYALTNGRKAVLPVVPQNAISRRSRSDYVKGHARLPDHKGYRLNLRDDFRASALERRQENLRAPYWKCEANIASSPASLRWSAQSFPAIFAGDNFCSAFQTGTPFAPKAVATAEPRSRFPRDVEIGNPRSAKMFLIERRCALIARNRLSGCIWAKLEEMSTRCICRHLSMRTGGTFPPPGPGVVPLLTAC